MQCASGGGPSPALAPRGALCQLRGELCVTRVTVTLCLELCSPLTKGGSTAQQRLGRGAEAPPLSWTQGASAVDRGPGSVRPDFLSLLKRWLHYKVLKITSTAWNQPRPLPSLPVSSGSADRTFPPRTSRPLKAPKSRRGLSLMSSGSWLRSPCGKKKRGKTVLGEVGLS